MDPFEPPVDPPATGTAIPAALLMAAGGSWFVVAVAILLIVDPSDLGAFESSNDLHPQVKAAMRIGTMLLSMGLSALMLHGGAHMWTLRSYRAARRACLAACVPFCGAWYLLSIPIGIWGLLVLRRDDVRASFSD